MFVEHSMASMQPSASQNIAAVSTTTTRVSSALSSWCCVMPTTRYIWAHVGSPGSQSDCGIYNKSPMFQGIQDETIKLPPPEPLPNDTDDTPFFFIGDDAFPLRQHMLKPFSARYLETEQLVFNYRLSCARQVVENLFGILASRFRCLLHTIEVAPEKAISITKACLTLHNLFRDRYGVNNVSVDEEDDNKEMIPGQWEDRCCHAWSRCSTSCTTCQCSWTSTTDHTAALLQLRCR